MNIRLLVSTLILWLVLWVCGALGLGAQSAGKKPVTVDDVASAHRNDPLTPIWTPDGKAFAYEDKGALNLYDVASHESKEWFRPADLGKLAKKGTPATDSAWQNRRVNSDSFQWFPNGKDLLAAVEGDLFVVHPNGKHEQITKTEAAEEDPKLSPDGARVLYRSKSNLFIVDLATKQLRQLTTDGTPTLLNGQLDWVYPEELYIHTATWWSPDSKQIAYFQFDVSHEFMYPQTDFMGQRAVSEPERYPQAGTPNALVKLGVIPAEGGTTKWLDVGETSNSLLARVAWLPDSSQVAVERLNRMQDKLDLLFCDPTSGAARTILHEQSKTWINMENNLYFLKSRPEFLWTTESSGFRHIYRYSNKGEILAQLTMGDWEVQSIAGIDEPRQKVYFSSNEASPLESQLYSVSFSGGERTRLTPEDGQHRIAANSDGSAYLDTFSSSKRPPETQLRSTSGGQSAVLRPVDTKPAEEFDLLPSEIMQVKTSDGVTLFGRLTRPQGFQTGTPYPLIVQVYGGPGVQTVLNDWQGVDMTQALAHRGYLVWQLDNRGSTGRGHAFEAPIYRNLGEREVADQRLGVEHLISLGLVDPKRVGITGWSYGGYMTMHSMLLAPDIFKVGVAGAPVTDWHNYDTIYTERYMGVPDKNQKGYESGSNVQNAGKLEGRLLILHNIEDDNVLFQNTMQMANALEKANKVFYMQIYPQKTHGVSGTLRKPLLEETAEFFDNNLKNAK